MQDRESEWAGLMRAAIAGDEAAYRRLLSALVPWLRALARRGLARSGTGDADAEDIVQEALLRVHGALEAGEVDGTLIGFWAPVYAGTVNIPGYHFHFVSDDRNLGGHVLGLETGHLEIGVQVQSELHLAMPSTPEFLDADLSGSHEDALHRAETGVGSTPPTKAKTRT